MFYSGMMGAMGGNIGNVGAVDGASVFKKRMQEGQAAVPIPAPPAIGLGLVP